MNRKAARMNLKRSGARCTLLWFLAVCGASVINAGSQGSESFSMLGALPDGWSAVYSGDTAENNFTDPAVVNIPGAGNYLRLSRPATPSVSAGVLLTEKTFTDVSGSVIVRFGSDSLHRASVVLRAQDKAYQPAGYGITVRTSQTDGLFQLGIINTVTVGSSNAHALGGWVDLGRANFAVDTDYEIRFSIVGDTIVGEVWTSGATPAKLGETRVSHSGVAAPGHIGLRHNCGNTNAMIYFRNLRTRDHR